MSSGTVTPQQRYKVWVAGRVRSGSAEQILTQIQASASPDSEVHRLPLEKYARVLVEDAPYFLPDGIVPEHLASRQFANPYERALEYLAAMPSSGVRVPVQELNKPTRRAARQ